MKFRPQKGRFPFVWPMPLSFKSMTRAFVTGGVTRVGDAIGERGFSGKL